MERAEAKAEARKRRMESMKIGVGAVVDFLAGWIPGGNKGDDPTPSVSSTSDETDMRQQSPPPSPLAHKRRTSHSTITTASSSSTKYSNSTSPTIRHQHTTHTHHNIHHEPHHLRHHLHHHHPPHRDALPHPNIQRLRSRASASEGLRTYAQVSAARGYLRHMASTPNMPRGLPSPREVPTARRIITLNGEDHVPPMPSKWLQTVTKAVLGSSAAGAYTGDLSLSRPSSRLSARTGRSSRSTGTRADPSIPQGVNPSKVLTSYLQRSKTAPGKVTTVRVLCRSAPASRSSSRSGDRVPHTPTNKGKSKDKDHQRKGGIGLGQSRKPRGRKKSDGVPMLANIRIEDDSLGIQWYDGRRIPTFGTTFAVADEDDGDDYYEDEEDEGEVDLARLLVPPKRQRSIRSLRRHLHRNESARGFRSGSGLGVCAIGGWSPEDEEGSGTMKGRRETGKRGMVEGGEDGWGAYGAPGFEFAGTKRRRGIPGAWTSISRGR